MSRRLMTSERQLIAVSGAGWLVMLGSIVAAVRLFRSDTREARRG